MSYHCESMSYQAVLSQAPADLYPPEIKIPSLHPPRLKMWVMLRMMLKRRMRSSRKRRVKETMPEVLALKIGLAGKLWVVLPGQSKHVTNFSITF